MGILAVVAGGARVAPFEAAPPDPLAAVTLSDDGTGIELRFAECRVVRGVELTAEGDERPAELVWAVAHPSGRSLDRVRLGTAPEGFRTVVDGGVPLDAAALVVEVETAEGTVTERFSLHHLSRDHAQHDGERVARFPSSPADCDRP